MRPVDKYGLNPTDFESSPAYQAVYRELYRAEHMRSWVASVHGSDADTADISPSILRELYPNIWQYGPRGDVYLQQLHALKALLDELDAGLQDSTALGTTERVARFFKDFHEFSEVYHEWQIDLFEGALSTWTEDAGFMSPPSWTEFDEVDALHALSYHPLVFNDAFSYYKNFRASLEFFGYLTLRYSEVCSVTAPEVQGLMVKYRQRCTEWGLPY